MAEQKPVHILVTPGNVGMVHLTEAVSETEYLIQYALGKTVTVPEQLWADLYAHGVLLVLTPKNTPLVLNLPGVYRVIENSPTNGTLTTQTWTAISFGSGDVR